MLDVPEPDTPTEIDVTELMDCPEGLVQIGDEFHRPDDLIVCEHCAATCRTRATTCFNCGAEL